MKILANENVPGDVVNALRSAGHGVYWVRTEAPGSSDEEVLTRATAEQRIVMTFDKDFGELIFTRKVPVPPGVILLRTRLPSPEHAVRLPMAAVTSRSDWEGHFSVVEDAGIRMTRL